VKISFGEAAYANELTSSTEINYKQNIDLSVFIWLLILKLNRKQLSLYMYHAALKPLIDSPGLPP